MIIRKTKIVDKEWVLSIFMFQSMNMPKIIVVQKYAINSHGKVEGNLEHNQLRLCTYMNFTKLTFDGLIILHLSSRKKIDINSIEMEISISVISIIKIRK